MSKITVIIPLYNTAQLITRAIESLHAQEGDFQLECIVVEDGSSDNSLDVIQQIAKKFDRLSLKIISHLTNQGPSAARNSGLNHATGDWIFYLDSDDELPNDALKALHSQSSPEVDWVQGSYRRISPEREWQTLYRDAHYRSHREIADNYKQLNLSNSTNKLIRRSVAERHAFCQGLIFEDTLWCQQHYPDLQNVVTTTTATYNHYIREGSIMQSRYTVQKVDSMLHIIQYIASNKPDKNQQHTVVELALNLIKNLYLSKFSSSYRRQIVKQISASGVTEMAYERSELTPFIKGLSHLFRKNSPLYYQIICYLYRVYLALFSSKRAGEFRGE